MIIQCEQCRTKFRLDDTKVKEGGVKVRCSKCKHVFLVSREAPAEEPDFDALLSGLGAASAGQGAAAAPTPAESGEAPAPAVAEGSLHEEHFAPPPAAAAMAPAAFPSAGLEEFAFSPEPPAVATSSLPDFGAVGETDRPASELFVPSVASEEVGTGAAAKLSGEEAWQMWDVSAAAADQEAVAPPEGREMPGGPLEFDELAAAGDEWGAPAPPEPSAEEFAAPTAFGEEFTQAVAPEQAAEEAPAHSQDFSFELPPDEHGAATPRQVPTEMEPLDFGTLVAEAAPPGPKETSPAAVVPEAEPGPAPLGEGPVPPFAPSAGKAADDEELPPLSIVSRRRSSSFLTIVLTAVALLVMLAALGIGSYLYREGPAGLAKMGLGFLSQWMDLEPAEEGTIMVRNGTGTYVESPQAGLLLMVTGEAVNQFKKPRASIQIKVTLFDAQGQPVASKSAFCGNMLSRDQVATLPLAKIEAAMNNQFGDSLANLGVLPGKAIPFLVVFSALPPTAVDFGIEVAGSTVASQQ